MDSADRDRNRSARVWWAGERCRLLEAGLFPQRRQRANEASTLSFEGRPSSSAPGISTGNCLALTGIGEQTTPMGCHVRGLYWMWIAKSRCIAGSDVVCGESCRERTASGGTGAQRLMSAGSVGD